MLPAVCAKCGKDTKVPFEPHGDKPVYCSDCYRKVRLSIKYWSLTAGPTGAEDIWRVSAPRICRGIMTSQISIREDRYVGK